MTTPTDLLGLLLGGGFANSAFWWWSSRRLRLKYDTREYVRGERIALVLAFVFLVAAGVNVVLA